MRAPVDAREPARVLHFARVINRYDFIDTVVRFADPQRFRMGTCVMTPDSNIERPDYGDARISYAVLGAGKGGWRRAGLALAVLALTRLLRRERIDILHTHHYEEAVIGVLAARLAGTPATAIGRHYHDELYLAAAGAKLRALLAVERFCHRLARLVIVPSHAIRDLLVARQNLRAEKIRVVPYGFDFAAERYRDAGTAEVSAARRELGLGEDFVVGSFGRHHPLKGHAYLIRAFAGLVADIPRARLLLVGDGPARACLRRLADELGIADRVVFAGWRRDVPRLLGVVDVVVHPTLHEAFSQLVVEALAHGRPLVVSRVSGVDECVEDGRTGLVVPPRDVRAIREAVRWVASHRDAACRMGEAGRSHVRGTLDIRGVVRGYEAAYAEALGR